MFLSFTSLFSLRSWRLHLPGGELASREGDGGSILFVIRWLVPVFPPCNGENRASATARPFPPLLRQCGGSSRVSRHLAFATRQLIPSFCRSIQRQMCETATTHAILGKLHLRVARWRTDASLYQLCP